MKTENMKNFWASVFVVAMFFTTTVTVIADPPQQSGGVVPIPSGSIVPVPPGEQQNQQPEGSGQPSDEGGGGPAPPSITVITPNGGENWQRGTSHVISWDSYNAGSYVKIELYRSGSLDSIIVISTTNDGSYTWSIPTSQVTGSTYKVKITSLSDSSIYDYSDNYFTISQAPSGWQQLIGDESAYGGGFGQNHNIATRPMVIYNNELYVGTENLNKPLLENWDEELEQLNEHVPLGGGDDHGGPVSSLPVSIGEQTPCVLGQDEYVYSPTHDGNGYYYEPETFCIDDMKTCAMTKGIRVAMHMRAFSSNGGDLWKYSSSTSEWTQVVGENGISDYDSGFDYPFNYAISVMKEFKGKLYVGTWSTPYGSISNNPPYTRKGCEVWRYDGSTWTQVVGRDAPYKKGGFLDTSTLSDRADNIGAMSIEEFNGYLYIGTINWNVTSTGGCQIWRTSDGLHWNRVVNRGFRDFGSQVTNTYAWVMKNYSGKLYVGTFNSQFLVTGENMGCELWSSSNGVTWTYETLPYGNGGRGFGEPENWGIRQLVKNNADGLLYVGTATNFNQASEGLEIWRYNGASSWSCVVGEHANGQYGQYCGDGFSDLRNKYAWSMAWTTDGLWAGTSKDDGCQVYLFKDNEWKPRVRTGGGGEIPDGFGDDQNIGARTIAEYPLGSRAILVGTFTSYVNPEEVGCEIWIRYPS